MRMNEIVFAGAPPIDAYGDGGFRLGGVRNVGSLALLPTRMFGWAPATAAQIDAAAVAEFVAAADDIDVLLIGLGPDIAPLGRAARAALEGAGIGVEIMSTAAACRTYNVLLAEGRRVAAALIAV